MAHSLGCWSPQHKGGHGNLQNEGIPLLPELQEYGEERKTEGQGLSPGKYAHPESGVKKGSGEV